MPHVAIESVILVPLLLLQIIVFPLTVSTMSSVWADARMQVALQDVANHLGSTIEQLYFSVNQREISAGIITKSLTLPPTIESYPYTARGSLRIPLDPNSSRVLVLSLTLQATKNTATATVTLGPNVLWVEEPVFQSSSLNASIKVQKFANGTLLFSFG